MSLKPLSWLRSIFEALYGIYAVVVFLILGIVALALVTLVPGLSIKVRRAIAQKTARLFFVCAGIRIRTVRGFGYMLEEFKETSTS